MTPAGFGVPAGDLRLAPASGGSTDGARVFLATAGGTR